MVTTNGIVRLFTFSKRLLLIIIMIILTVLIEKEGIIIANGKVIYAETTVGSANEFSYSVEINDETNTTIITMTGIRDRYLAVGFGNTNMFDCYCLIWQIVETQDWAVHEEWLYDEKAGIPMPMCGNHIRDTCVNIISHTEYESTQTVVMERANNVSQWSNWAYTFTTDTLQIPTTWAYGYYGKYFNHGLYQRGGNTLAMVDPFATTVMPSEDTYKWIPMQELDDSGIMFQAKMTADQMIVTVVGPADRYFGFAFGTTMTKADGPCYTTGTAGTLTAGLYDYYFTGYDPSNCVLDSQQDWNVLSITVDAGLRTIEAWRDLDTGDTTGDVVLKYGDATLPMIWAKAQSATLQLSDHGGSDSQRGAVNLQWSIVSGNKTTLLTSSPTPPSLRPTQAPTPVPPPESTATEKNFRVTDIVEGILSVGVYMNRTHVRFSVYGPLDNWFAIGWGGHTSGDALIYTIGYTNKPQAPYDYKLRGKTTSLVTEDDINNYVVEIDTVRNETRRYIQVVRLLDTGDSDDVSIDFNNDQMEIMYAWGSSSSLELEYHGTNYGTVVLDLASGGGSLSRLTVGYEGFEDSEHSILMFMAFGVLMPISTFIKRYALRFQCCWHKYTLQLHRILASVGYLLAIAGFFIKLASVKGVLKQSLHAKVGYLLLSSIGIYSLLSWFYCFKSAMDYNHSTIQMKSEFRQKYLHNFVGYIFVIAGMLNIYLGLEVSDSSMTVLYGYCGYVLVFWGIFAIFECLKNILHKGKGEDYMFEVALVEKKSLVDNDQFNEKHAP